MNQSEVRQLSEQFESFREDHDAIRADLKMVSDLFPRLDDRRDQQARP
ncbi:hypothetical protein RBH20_11850 [Haloarcula sp. H-GB4]|nr:hypothetical protein [Haloarcula sp. H-GB4]MDQ2073228.1 hypothetical protein [Haloarcula sp. H-GB4]